MERAGRERTFSSHVRLFVGVSTQLCVRVSRQDQTLLWTYDNELAE